MPSVFVNSSHFSFGHVARALGSVQSWHHAHSPIIIPSQHYWWNSLFVLSVQDVQLLSGAKLSFARPCTSKSILSIDVALSFVLSGLLVRLSLRSTCIGKSSLITSGSGSLIPHQERQARVSPNLRAPSAEGPCPSGGFITRISKVTIFFKSFLI